MHVPVGNQAPAACSQGLFSLAADSRVLCPYQSPLRCVQAAWSISVELLSAPGAPESASALHYFSANTLYTKVRKHWHQLEAEHRDQLGAVILQVGHNIHHGGVWGVSFSRPAPHDADIYPSAGQWKYAGHCAWWWAGVFAPSADRAIRLTENTLYVKSQNAFLSGLLGIQVYPCVCVCVCVCVISIFYLAYCSTAVVARCSVLELCSFYRAGKDSWDIFLASRVSCSGQIL